jgi:hypothetical protein
VFDFGIHERHARSTFISDRQKISYFTFNLVQSFYLTLI